MYCNMVQHVHIDKKQLALVTNGNGFYLFSAKEHQYGNVNHNKHITKMMLLLKIAQPCIMPSTGELFDGKIDIWDFV